MNLPDEIRHLPDDQYLSVGFVREVLDGWEPEPEIVTISQAVERWSYSREWWRQRATEGEVPGAWQDSQGGTWRLPVEGCRRIIARQQSDGRRRGTTGPRGPRAWYATASHLPGEGQPVVEGGPQEVRRDTDGDAGPVGPRLAS